MKYTLQEAEQARDRIFIESLGEVDPIKRATDKCTYYFWCGYVAALADVDESICSKK